MALPKTLFEKIWQSHIVEDLGDGYALVLVDRHVMHDLGARSLIQLSERGLSIPYPELNFASSDHSIATMWNAAADPGEKNNPYLKNIRAHAPNFGFKFFDVDDPDTGIVHVITPEQAIALPGSTFACGDSHTCTIGALGVVAWGVGQTDTMHILATQTSVQRMPRLMRIRLEGEPDAMVTAKDVILYVIGKLGAASGNGAALEFAGPVIENFSMEGRFTICNMAVEMGARFGLIAPDQTTIDYLQGRPRAPTGANFDAAAQHWKTLFTDPEAKFETDITLDLTDIDPQITWGTSPEHVLGINGFIPNPANESEPTHAEAISRALNYVGLNAGTAIAGTPVDWVFIGSCTNGRISDLRAAANVAEGRLVADGVTAWVVPGSRQVANQAAAEGLEKVFVNAGFNWGSPGCSMCGGAGDQFREIMRPGQRAVSTTNRNFAGRQGPGSRTHLASPTMAVAAAVNGFISDVRELEG